MSSLTITRSVSKPYIFNDHDVMMHAPVNAYVMRVRDRAEDDKPREKLLRYGPAALDVSEIVAVLLGFGTKKEEVMSMSRRILHEYGERAIIHETSPKRLAQVLDIPITKACQLIAAFELGRRFYATRSGGKPVVVRTAQQAYEHFKDMSQLQKEHLRAVYLNSRYRVIHEEVISVGSLTANVVHPREVFQPAIEHGAVAVIIAHNHPSGALKPTSEDIAVTKQLQEGGNLLGIEVLDHLIISDSAYLSIMEEAL